MDCHMSIPISQGKPSNWSHMKRPRRSMTTFLVNSLMEHSLQILNFWWIIFFYNDALVMNKQRHYLLFVFMRWKIYLSPIKRLAWHKCNIWNFSDLLIACMKETYENSCATYSRNQRSLDLDSISANLSGVANPGSKQLLVQIKAEKI